MADRALSSGDRALLRRATLANMNGNERWFTGDDLDADPGISRYVERFPGELDAGLADHRGDTVRAVAWLVHLPEDDPGYGFVAAGIPELSITTFDGYRGQGIGTALLEALIAEARSRGLRALSLSVEDGYRARRLYERAGFRVVGRNGGSDTILLELGQDDGDE